MALISIIIIGKLIFFYFIHSIALNAELSTVSFRRFRSWGGRNKDHVMSLREPFLYTLRRIALSHEREHLPLVTCDARERFAVHFLTRFVLLVVGDDVLAQFVHAERLLTTRSFDCLCSPSLLLFGDFVLRRESGGVARRSSFGFFTTKSGSVSQSSSPALASTLMSTPAFHISMRIEQ